MVSIRHSAIIGLLMAAAAILSGLAQPTIVLADLRPDLSFQKAIPAQFGHWTLQPDAAASIVDPQLQQSLRALYAQTVVRSYVDAQGYRIMLSLAYGRTQRADLQLHHPEVCYPAQGFAIQSNRIDSLTTPYGKLPIRRLLTQLGRDRPEPVTYWSLVGDTVVLDSLSRKLVNMRFGSQGQIADGLLFRVSSIDRDSDRAFARQSSFITDLLAAVNPAERHRLAGL